MWMRRFVWQKEENRFGKLQSIISLTNYCALQAQQIIHRAHVFCYIRPQEAARSMHRIKAILVVFIIFGFSQAIAQTQRLSPEITASELEVCENDEVQLNLSYSEPENTSVQFDGASHQINFPADPAFDFGASGNFTVEFYMKQDNANVNPQSIIFKGASPGFAIGVGNGFIYVAIADGTNTVNLSGSTLVSDGSWHHVAVVFDRTNNATLYIDGAYDNDASIAGVGNINSADVLVAGAALNAGNPIGHYGGYLDELRIWSVDRTPGEITSTKDNHLNPASFPGLVGYWDFNDLTAPQVIDCSPTGATGTMLNGVALPPDAPALAWNFNTSWSTGQSGPNLTTIFVNPTDTTTYKVEIGYCKYFSVDSVTIAVVPCEDIDPATRISSVWAPNAFTPNGDNKNDVFLVQGSNLSSYEIMIFNRLGNIVYHSRNILNAWDGTLEGKVMKDDVYTYVINYTGYNNEGELQQFQKYGTVTIMH